MRVVLFILMIAFNSISQDKEILVLGNYTSLCLNDSTYQMSNNLPKSLDSIDIIMLFSSSTSNLKTDDIERIEQFILDGGGLYSGADNWPLQAESNQVTFQLYKKESFGNYEQDLAALNTQGDLKFSEYDSIPAGETTTAFPLDYRLKVEAWVQDQPLISSGHLGKGKIIIDGGYSRFYCIRRDSITDELLNQIIEFLSQ